jgi:uncharacterized pyridoxal phosphate-containing UPF0001 family protein
LSIARRLSEQRPFHAPPLNLCIQVELVPEPNKGGIAPGRGAATGGCHRGAAQGAPARLDVRAAAAADAAAERAVFARLRMLKEELNASGRKLDTLSMGMSGDFESAIAEGATQCGSERRYSAERTRLARLPWVYNWGMA